MAITKKNPLVSVIMPSYNRAGFITKSLNSVFAQTYRPIEIIVVDDGSTDHTEEVVKLWSNTRQSEDFEIHYVIKENGGAPSARNRGIKESKGEYLQFLDSDDVIFPRKLELQMGEIIKENTPLCICDYIHVDENDDLILTIENNFTGSEIIKRYRGTHTSIGIISKSFLKENRIRWNEKIKKLQDRDFYTRIFMIATEHSYVNEVLFKWIRHPGESRVFMQKIHKRKESKPILKSLVSFHLTHINSISFKKYPSIFSIYKMLLRYSLNLGRLKTIFKI